MKARTLSRNFSTRGMPAGAPPTIVGRPDLSLQQSAAEVAANARGCEAEDGEKTVRWIDRSSKSGFRTNE